MPGRRRRNKSTSHRKPSLIFIESPQNQTVSYGTPVRCSDHPATAKTVPVDELEDLTWVSPQFQGGVSSPGKRGKRRTKLSHSTINTRSRTLNSTNDVNTSSFPSRKLPRNFVPLRLQWDKTEEITDIQDVSENEDLQLNCTENFDGLDMSGVRTPEHNTDRTGQREDQLDLALLSDLVKKSESIRHQNSPSTLRHSERLRTKYREALQLFRSPVMSESRPSRILVLDTPEAEYGKSRRERQLISHRR